MGKGGITLARCGARLAQRSRPRMRHNAIVQGSDSLLFFDDRPLIRHPGETVPMLAESAGSLCGGGGCELAVTGFG